MKATSALAELGAFEAVEPEEKLLFSAYSNEMAESTQRLSPTAQRARSRALFVEVELERIIHSDGWCGYGGLVDGVSEALQSAT